MLHGILRFEAGILEISVKTPDRLGGRQWFWPPAS